MESNPQQYCLNCGSKLTGPYCATCGQKNIPPRQALGEMLMNFIGSFTSFESKFFKTVIFLLFRPGFLVNEYNKGRRESYFHPARAYVFSSFVFFLLFFWMVGTPDIQPDGEEQEVLMDSVYTKNGTNIRVTGVGDLTDYENFEAYDSAQNLLPASERDGWIKRYFVSKQFAMKEKYKGNKLQIVNDLVENAIQNVPKVFFVLLPLFALILKLLYIRGDYYFSEHLVFSVVFYNFIFVSSSIIMLVSLIPGMQWFWWLLFILPSIYLEIAMKKVYIQSYFKTTIKLVILTIIFSGCIFVALLMNFFVSLVTL